MGGKGWEGICLLHDHLWWPSMIVNQLPAEPAACRLYHGFVWHSRHVCFGHVIMPVCIDFMFVFRGLCYCGLCGAFDVVVREGPFPQVCVPELF